MQCGIGKVNAAAGAVEMIRNFAPDCIISTGVAGGIDSCLNVMDVVVSSRIVYHDVWCGEGNAYGQIQGLPLYFTGNETLYQCAISLDTETAIHGGLICSGDKFITDRQELETIKANFPEGLAVDMESASIARYAICTKFPSSASVSSVIHREQKSIWNNTRTSGEKWLTARSMLRRLSSRLCQTNFNSRIFHFISFLTI